jgi:acyl carrier protein
MDARPVPEMDFDADKVRRFIAENLRIDTKQVTDKAHFSDDLGLNWLDKLELMILIEYEFAGVEISDAAALKMEVVGDLVRHVEMSKKTRCYNEAEPKLQQSAEEGSCAGSPIGLYPGS